MFLAKGAEFDWLLSGACERMAIPLHGCSPSRCRKVSFAPFLAWSINSGRNKNTSQDIFLVPMAQQSIEQYRHVFEVFDQDKDGHITKDELKQILASLRNSSLLVVVAPFLPDIDYFLPRTSSVI